MSFVFRGTRSDIESGFPAIIPERRTVRINAGSPVNSNSLAFLVTVLLLFMILNSQQMSPNFLLWLVVGVFFMVTTLRMYATCQQLQARAQAHATAARALLGHTELRLHMPPSSVYKKRQDSVNLISIKKGSEDELTCSVCLEQVNVADLIRSLPCLHQFHANCIDPWLRQQGTCPICKFRAGSVWQENGGIDASYMA